MQNKELSEGCLQLGSFVKQLRKQSCIKQDYLAEQINISQAHLSRIEKGKAHLPEETIPLLCKIFSVEKTVFQESYINLITDSSSFVELNKRVLMLEQQVALLKKLVGSSQISVV